MLDGYYYPPVGQGHPCVGGRVGAVMYIKADLIQLDSQLHLFKKSISLSQTTTQIIFTILK